MRIAIMGAGAVGGYFGALLARAGHDVDFIARGEHLAAIRSRGIVLDGPRGRIEARVGATDDPATLAPAARNERAHRGGVAIALQNGVDGQDRLAAVLGPDRVMGGLAFVSGVITEPGVIRYTSPMSSLRFGEPDGAMSARGTAFRDACIASGFGAELMPDIRAAQWDKFVGLCTNAALTSLIRLPAGHIYHDPELVQSARAGFAEVAAVGRASGVRMADDVVERALALHQGFPKSMYASMYHDVARGRRLELESFSGHVVRLGRRHGVPTPVHEFAYRCLRPFVNGTPAAL